MQNRETEHLIKKAKQKDADAFTELMQLYMKDLYRVALAILMNDEDAADAIQDTILTCWEKLGTLKKDRYFKTWMTKILINKCYDIRRKSLRIVGLEAYEEAASGACWGKHQAGQLQHQPGRFSDRAARRPGGADRRGRTAF